MRPISPSRILTYGFCKRSYELQYTMRIPSAQHIEGIAIHDAVEVAHKRQEPPELSEPFASNYEATIKKLGIGGDALTEVSLNGIIKDIPVTGRLDLLDANNRIVLDWKSGQGTTGYEVQGWLYQELVRYVYGFTPDVWFSYLRLGKLKMMDMDDLWDGEKVFWSFIHRNKNRKVTRRFDPSNGQCKACGYRFICGMTDEDLESLRK